MFLGDVEDDVEIFAGDVGFRSSSLVESRNIRIQTPLFGVKKNAGVAPFYAQECKSSIYLIHCSKSFLHALWCIG
jgi:hypothetical protein